MGYRRFRDRSGWNFDRTFCRFSFIMYPYNIFFQHNYSFHDYNVRQATQACHQHKTDLSVVGEMPPVAMLEVGVVMSTTQVSWAFQRMQMIHDCFHQLFRALGMIQAKRRHVNRIVPAGSSCDHSFGISLGFHPERNQAKYEGFRRLKYGDCFVGMEHVHELGYDHVHFCVYGLLLQLLRQCRLVARTTVLDTHT